MPPFAISWTRLVLQITNIAESANEIQPRSDNYNDLPDHIWPPAQDKLLESILARSQSFNQSVVKDVEELLYTIQLRTSCRIRHLQLSKLVSHSWFQGAVFSLIEISGC